MNKILYKFCTICFRLKTVMKYLTKLIQFYKKMKANILFWKKLCLFQDKKIFNSWKYLWTKRFRRLITTYKLDYKLIFKNLNKILEINKVQKSTGISCTVFSNKNYYKIKNFFLIFLITDFNFNQTRFLSLQRINDSHRLMNLSFGIRIQFISRDGVHL